MSHRQTILPPSARASLAHPTSSIQNTTHQTALQTRIAAKRAELTHLHQLRDLSGQLAAQMSALESRLATLRDGAESVAVILANWEDVLGVIRMASCMVPPLFIPPLSLSVCSPNGQRLCVVGFLREWEWVGLTRSSGCAAKLPPPPPVAEGEEPEPQLPTTLVRIPIGQQLQQQQQQNGDAHDESHQQQPGAG